MTKAEAIRLLGGTPATAAAAIGVSVQAISQWKHELTRKQADRVQAALWRMAQGAQPRPTEKASA